MDKDLTRVPFFLFAESPAALRKLCFNNNATNDSLFDYVVIPPTPENDQWGVWFLASAARYQTPEDIKVIDKQLVSHG